MKFNYFYGEEGDRYSFINIPKTLMKDVRFSEVNVYAKVLYGLLLDRMSMALKNKWIDQEKRVYVIYPVQEIERDMGITTKKAHECLKELEVIGLIEKKKRGAGLPCIIYLRDFGILQEG